MQDAILWRACWTSPSERTSDMEFFSVRVRLRNMKSDHATLDYAGDDFFVAVTQSGHAQVLDIRGERSAASGPLELLLVALGGCTGADVISVLKKKRERVTAYRVEVRGERREEHPRSVRRLEVREVV